MKLSRLVGFLGGGLLIASAALADESFNAFRLAEVTGIVKIKADDNAEYQAGEVGKDYQAGVTIQTARRSSAVLEFTPDNRVRVLANSEVKVVGKAAMRNTARIELHSGDVDGRLQALPKGMKFEVETPVGICGATGTDFSVGYGRLADNMTREMVMDCTEGQLVLEGDFVRTEEDTIRAGSTFRFTLVQCDDRDYAFLPDVEIAGQDLNVAFGQKNIALLGNGSWSQAAMGNVPGETPFAALRVLAGQVLISGFAMTEELPAGFIRDRTLIYVDEGQAGYGFYRDIPQDALIENYDGAQMTIAGNAYNTDVIVYPERVLGGFWFGTGERIFEDMVKDVVAYGPQTVIFGTGPAGLKTPPEAVLNDLKGRGIEVFALPTAKAVELYNEMRKQQPAAKTVAVLNLEDYRNAEEYMNAAEELCRRCAALGACGNCCQFYRGYIGELPEPEVPTAVPTPTRVAAPPVTLEPPLPISDVPQSPGEL